MWHLSGKGRGWKRLNADTNRFNVCHQRISEETEYYMIDSFIAIKWV